MLVPVACSLSIFVVGSALWLGSFMSLLAVAVVVNVRPVVCVADGMAVARGAVLKPYDRVRVTCPSRSTMFLPGLLLLGARFVPAFRVSNTDQF